MLQYCKNVAPGDENLSFSPSDPVSRLPTFLVVPTDRQPSSGYVR